MSESSSGEEFEDICPSDPPVPKWPLPPVCALIAAPKAASLCVFGDRVPSKPLRLSIEDSANVRLDGFFVADGPLLCVRGDRVPSKPLRLSIEDSANVRLDGFLVKPIVRLCVRIERSTKSCLIVRALCEQPAVRRAPTVRILYVLEGPPPQRL